MSDVIYEHNETGERVNCFYFFGSNSFKIPKWIYSREDYLCTDYYSGSYENDLSDSFVKIRFKRYEDNDYPEFYYISSGMGLIMFNDGQLVIQSYPSFIRQYSPIIEISNKVKEPKKDIDDKPNLAVLYNALSSYIKREYEDKNIKTPIELYFFKVISEYYLGKK